MCVDDVKAMPQGHVDAQAETAGGKIRILADVAQESLESEPLSSQRRLPLQGHFFENLHFWNSVNMNSANILRAFLPISSQANHRDIVPLFAEQFGFIPNSYVAREMVFNQH